MLFRPLLPSSFTGYVSGSGCEPLFKGTELASSGNVMVITVNYCLGAFGFLFTDPSTGSGGMNGVHDVINALTWIKANAKSFGGDPSAIT